MDPISLTSIAISSISLAANALRPRMLQRLGSDPDTSLRVLKTHILPKVDIVCVPDVNESPLPDWTTQNGPTSVNWLNDLLPLSFPEARILLFGFNPSALTHEGFTRQTIHTQAYELLGHLWTRRRGIAERRPLLFLVHGSGALIARSALFQSSAAITERDAHLKSIYLSTGALFIYDTVKKHEILSESWQDVLDKAMNKVPNRLVKDPGSKAQSTEWLEWQQNRFRAIASNIATTTLIVRNSPRTRSETGQRLFTAAITYKNMKFLGDHAHVEQLWRDTSDVMIFDGVEDLDYRTLVSHLRNNLEEGVSKTKAKWDLHFLHTSLTTAENDDWVKEAENEYSQQLRDTINIWSEWQSEANNKYLQLSPSEASDRPSIKLNVALNVTQRAEEECGFLHARTLECLQDLATQFIEVEISTAESILQRLLVSWDHIFGMRNIRVLRSIQQIANIKKVQRRFADCSVYLSKAIDLRLKLLMQLEDTMAIAKVGAEPQGKSKQFDQLNKRYEAEQEAIARCQIDLAISYDMQERFSEAEMVYAQVLRSRKEEVDECRLLCLENQALHWRKRGNLTEAAKAYKAVLEAHEKNKTSISRRQYKLIESKWKEVSNVLAKKKNTGSLFSLAV